MGRHWGQVGYSRGLVRYAISQYEQNAMYGFFKKGAPNMAKRVYSQVFKVVPRKYEKHHHNYAHMYLVIMQYYSSASD